MHKTEEPTKEHHQTNKSNEEQSQDPILCDIMKAELLRYFKERLLAYTSKEIQLQRQCSESENNQSIMNDKSH